MLNKRKSLIFCLPGQYLTKETYKLLNNNNNNIQFTGTMLNKRKSYKLLNNNNNNILFTGTMLNKRKSLIFCLPGQCLTKKSLINY